MLCVVLMVALPVVVVLVVLVALSVVLLLPPGLWSRLGVGLGLGDLLEVAADGVLEAWGDRPRAGGVRSLRLGYWC